MKSYFSIREDLLAAIICQSAENSGVKECGGILIGERRGPHIAITEITLPGTNDQSGFARFIRVDPSHQASAMKAWVASNETQSYVGEWHTHPVGKAMPSSVDKATWEAAAKQTGTPLLFIIATPSEIGVYRGEMISRKSSQKFKLNSIELMPVKC